MGAFAMLESGINGALGEVLDLKGIRSAVVTRNMSFADKIRTLRTLVDIFVLDREKAKSFDKLARKAQGCAETRNIVAHNPFRASPKSDGVEFFSFKASSTLQILDIDWSIDDFIQKIDEITSIDNGLRDLEKVMPMERIARALMRPADTKSTSALGGLLGLGSATTDEQ